MMRKFCHTLKRVISLMLVMTIVTPLFFDITFYAVDGGISSVFKSLGNSLFGYAASWQAGTSTGTGLSGFGNTNGGVIGALYPDCGFSITISRDTDLKFFTSTSGADPYTNMWNESSWDFPSDIENSTYLIAKSGSSCASSGRSTYVAVAGGGSNLALYGNINNFQFRSADKYSSSPVSKGVYYDKIYTKLKEAGGRTYIKDNFDSFFNDSSKSLQAWSYITSPTGSSSSLVYHVDDRFAEVFNHNNLDFAKYEEMSGDEALKLEAQIIDVLASIWSMTPNKSNSKAPFKDAVLEYLDGVDFKEKPMAVKLTPLIGLSDNKTNSYYFMTTLSFTNWVAALHNNYKLGTSSWKAYVKSTNSATLKGSFMNMLVEATKLSIRDLPNVVRVSSQSWARPTSFIKHASPALYYKVFSSTANNPRWFNKTSAYADPNMNDIIVYHPQGQKPAMGQAANAMWGLMLIPMSKPGSTASFGLIQANPDGQVIDSKTLGMPVTVNIFAGQTSQEQKDNWKTIIANAEAFKSTFDIKVEIQRTSSNYGSATLPVYTRSGVTTEEMTRIIHVNPIEPPSILLVMRGIDFASSEKINALSVAGFKVTQRVNVVAFVDTVTNKSYYCYESQLRDEERDACCGGTGRFHIENYYKDIKDAASDISPTTGEYYYPYYDVMTRKITKE